MNLNEFRKLKEDLRARYGPPLKAVKMSRATAASFPQLVPAQTTVETLYGVPIEWDETLGLGEYEPIYAPIYAQPQTLFGLPVVVSDAVTPGTALVGSYPTAERPNMTLEEYAQQCARHFSKIRLEPDP